MKFNLTYLGAIVLHILIGMLVYFEEDLAKLHFGLALAYFSYLIVFVQKEQKTIEILKASAYFVGAEVFFRMTKGAFSYEAIKYLVILLMMAGMFYNGVSGKAYPYFIYLMFLIPSIFVASTTLSFDANFRTNIAFVLSGPVCLGISALYCYDKKISLKQCNKVLLFMLLPIISHATYIYFYNPTVRDVLSNNASNRTSSGGWGPNQVATILGLGMFIMATRIFTKSPSLLLKAINVFIFSAITYRAVVTFSRGGVIASIICIMAFIVMYFLMVNSRKKNEVVLVTILFGFTLIGTWTFSSNQTEGFIDLRYANKNHRGQDKKDVSTGRGELFMNEIEGFITNPFFGIGSSRAKDARIELKGQGITSHNEISRTLSEHGIFGIIMLVILIFKPMDFRTKNRQNYYFYAFLCFWFATINHSSMRIAAPAFIYALALLKISNEKRPVHRQLPSA